MVIVQNWSFGCRYAYKIEEFWQNRLVRDFENVGGVVRGVGVDWYERGRLLIWLRD
jgi:hypothetical protein